MFKVISTQLQFLVQFLQLVDEHLSSWWCLKPDNSAYVGGIAMEITTILLQKQHLYLPIAPAFLPKVKAKKYIQLSFWA